jgi:hypothetical protein
MRIYNEIWAHPRISRKWHIDVWPQLRANTFLPMSTTKFVTNDRVSRVSKAYVSLLQKIKCIS